MRKRISCTYHQQAFVQDENDKPETHILASAFFTVWKNLDVGIVLQRATARDIIECDQRESTDAYLLIDREHRTSVCDEWDRTLAKR